MHEVTYMSCANKKLDSLIAEHVLGWYLDATGNFYPHGTEIYAWCDENHVLYEEDEWEPSIDLNHAWVAAKTLLPHAEIHLHTSIGYEKAIVFCDMFDEEQRNIGYFKVADSTPAKAICLALLKYKEIDVESALE